ncbi:MAG: hypothetical protein DSY92_00130, partial [Planctomycetota bacterium]
MNRTPTLLLLLALAALSACTSQPLLQQQASVLDVSADLEKIRAASDLPGMACMAVRNGKLVGFGVAGVRSVRTKEKIEIDDPFHMGSCTKAMTSTLAAVLIVINLGVNALIMRFSDPFAGSDFMLSLTLGLVWLAYVLLLAVPFVPSTEIGISLLITHGAVAAPFVYLGTLSGLMLAYGA